LSGRVLVGPETKAKLNDDRPSTAGTPKSGLREKANTILYGVSIQLVQEVKHRKAVTIADGNTAPEISLEMRIECAVLATLRGLRRLDAASAGLTANSRDRLMAAVYTQQYL
jgi:hypothetical protein